MNYLKNTSGQYLYFVMVDASDGSAITSGTVNGYRSIDGGAQASVTGTISHKGNGQWELAMSQADTNGDEIGFLFTHASGVPVSITIVTDTKKISSLNDVSAADVNDQADTALSDYDPPTHDEIVALFQLALRSDPAIGTDRSATLSLINADEGSGGGDYDQAAESQEALRDRGDAAWVTGGGGSLSEILSIQAIIPPAIDLANTATWRLGIMLMNSLDDLPSAAEISPGTISIDRKAAGATSWSAIVTDAAMSEVAGLIYYDEVFDSGSGYAAGDMIRITLKNQKITVSTNDHEITGSGGVVFYTHILDQAAAGGTDWTTAEKNQIRYRLQMDGTVAAPAANTPSQLPVDVQELDGDSAAALQQKRMITTAIYGTVASGSTTTVVETSGLAGNYGDSRVNGRTIYFLNGSSLEGEAASIEGYNDTSGQITVSALSAAPTAGDEFVII